MKPFNIGISATHERGYFVAVTFHGDPNAINQIRCEVDRMPDGTLVLDITDYSDAYEALVAAGLADKFEAWVIKQVEAFAQDIGAM